MITEALAGLWPSFNCGRNYSCPGSNYAVSLLPEAVMGYP